MNISEEMVRELQKRVDVSYEEAEYTLKKTRGDINMALYLIMKRRNSGWERFKTSLSDVFSQLIRYRLILTRKGKVLVDLPLFLLVLLVLMDGFYRHIVPLFVIFLLILIFECQVKIEKSSEEEQNSFEETIIKTTAPIKPQQPVVVEKGEEIKNKDPNEDDYFEIVIEE